MGVTKTYNSFVMNGTLNGVRLRRITWLVMNQDGNWGRTTVRVLESPRHDLEKGSQVECSRSDQILPNAPNKVLGKC